MSQHKANGFLVCARPTRGRVASMQLKGVRAESHRQHHTTYQAVKGCLKVVNAHYQVTQIALTALLHSWQCLTPAMQAGPGAAGSGGRTFRCPFEITTATSRPLMPLPRGTLTVHSDRVCVQE